MSRPRAVIFDLGHTVWNYAPTEAGRRRGVLQLHARLLEDFGAETPDPRAIERSLMAALERDIRDWYADPAQLAQPSGEHFVETAFAELGLPPSGRLIADIVERLFGGEPDMPVVEPDTLSAIAALHNQGVLMGCITNTFLLQSAIEDVLSRLGLVRYLAVAVVSSAMGYRKPHASLFRRALDALGVAPEDAVFVGDRLVDDVSGARAVGMRAVLTHQYRQEPLDGAATRPDAVIRRLGELPAVLAKLEYDGDESSTGGV